MNQGKTLTELAAELERQKKEKRDFLAPCSQLEMMPQEGQDFHLRVNGKGQFGIARLGHEQLAGRLGIPQRYYDRMAKEAPELLRHNVNGWLLRENEPKLVRTMDGQVRAFLSDRYRPLDNYDLASTVLPILSEPGQGVRVESCELTERRLYIKAVMPKLEMQVRVGDAVQAGIVISNSEVGCGSVKVEPMVYRLVCENGMIVADSTLRKYHVGRSGDSSDLAEEFYRDETRRADDRAFWMKVADVVRGAFNEALFKRMVARMQATVGNEITGDPVKVVELVAEKYGLNDDFERPSVLRWLIKDGDLTQYGLMNAVTRTAQEIPDYERSTDFERLGGKILELPQGEWKELAGAK